MKPIAITRENHLNFCEESPLTKNEWRRWHVLRDVLWAGDKKLQAFIEKRVRVEQDAHLAASELETKDWSNMVVFSDTLAILKRAQLVAYGEWLERKK